MPPREGFRYYEKEYPEAGDLVKAKVNKVTDVGAYCSLLEYNNHEGMIMLSEISRRRIRSIAKLVRVGRIETPVVLRVNREKGYIDLSKKRIDQTPAEKEAYEDKYNKAKALNCIIGHIAHSFNDGEFSMQQLYEMFGWEMLRKYDQGQDPFALALTDQFFEVFKGVPEKIRPVVLKNLRKQLTPQICKITSDIKCHCFKSEGIDAIISAFKAALELSTEDLKLEIKLISPPKYVVSCKTLLKEEGIALVNKAVGVIKDHLTKKGGQLEQETPAGVQQDVVEAP